MLSVASWEAPIELHAVSEFMHADALRPHVGDVLVMRLDGGPEEHGVDAAVPALVAGLRNRHPGCAVTLWIPAAATQVVIEAVRAAGHAHVRGIVGGDPLDPALLRRQLTHPHGLSAFVLRWASDAGYLPPGLDHDDVRDLLDAPPDVRTLQRLAARRQVAARTWRSHLQQLGLPTPHAWLGLAHALHVAFFVQRHHTEPLQALCDQLRMQTLANMTQQFRRVFGLSPSAVRDLLGAEPLLHRWFHARVRR